MRKYTNTPVHPAWCMALLTTIVSGILLAYVKKKINNTKLDITERANPERS